MNNQEPQISIPQCQLCFAYQNIQLLELKEQIVQVCSDCQTYVTNVIVSINLNLKKLNAVYKNNIELVMDSNNIQFKKKQCGICFDYCICSRMSYCEHFFCLDCFQFYISNQTNFDIKCPYFDCEQVIDDYFLFWFISIPQFNQWVIEKYYFFCPNRNCKTILQFIPFQYVESKIVQISINQSQCSSCQTIICTKCWKEQNGTNVQHQIFCKQDIWITQLLEQSNILQCPKCKIPSEQDCTIRDQKFQQCVVCRSNFCLFCKTTDLQLFNKQKLFKYTCNCKQNFKKRKNIQIILFTVLKILYILIIGIIVALGNKLNNCINYIEEKVGLWNHRYIWYLYYIFFPIFIVLKIFGKFCKFVVGKESILRDFTYQILGIYEEVQYIRENYKW